jgi:acetyl esterase/lipase
MSLILSLCGGQLWLRRHAPSVAVAALLFAIRQSPAQPSHEMPVNIGLQCDIRYRQGASEAWKLDLAYPKTPGTKLRPGLVIIHGGGWIEGDKSSFTSLKHWAPGNIVDFAKLGIVAASLNYRMSGEAPFPAALEDCKNAVRWLRAHADEFHIDSNRIGAYGNSAGGHLALLLGLVEKNAGLEGNGPYQEHSSMVQAVISDSGPVDLDFRKPENKGLALVTMKFLAGGSETLPERIRKASPVSYINTPAPPLLLIYGTADAQVTVGPVDNFVLALHKGGQKDLTYLRLGLVDHCPYSLVKVESLYRIVDEFLIRTLMPN